ncbi:caspase-9 [Eucyclogobius newberryi]|uniref:caspase-9 n=1 Tax=Eucyclogobius newberryi TaxID=166745 RepID=UPI003B58DBA7
MDEKHKKILQRNRTSLVKELDPTSLCDLLLEKGVFSQDMIDEIKSAGTRRDQARQLARDIETRGSRAFSLFVESLEETGQIRLVRALKEDTSEGPVQPEAPPEPRTTPEDLPVPRTRPEVRPLPRPEVRPLPAASGAVTAPPMDMGRITLSPSAAAHSPEGDVVRPQRTRRDSIQTYRMDSSPSGHCLIINNVEFEPRSELSRRSGSNVDCDRLQRRFRDLNFTVQVKTDLRQKQIRQELSSLSKKDHSSMDCCVVIILSHGTEVSHNRFPGAVYGVDGLHVPVQNVTNFLNGQHCPSLQGKPKLFFIQACGGGEKDTGFEVSPDEDDTAPSCGGGEDDQTDAIPTSSSSDSLSTSDEPDARTTLPTPSDILVSYSTFPGYVSWRDTQAGSWYVETLDRVLAENAATDDLVTMLMMVNHEVSQNSAKGLYKQMPGSFNFLRKLLYFQPRT